MDSPVFGMLNVYFVKKRALANSVAFAGSGIGCLVIPLVLNYAIEYYSARGAMFILGGLWLQGCIIAAILRPIRQSFVIDEVDIEITVAEETEKKLMTVDSELKCVTSALIADNQETDEEEEQSQAVLQSDEAKNCVVNYNYNPEQGLTKQLLVEETNAPKHVNSVLICASKAKSDNKHNILKAAVLDYWSFLSNMNMLLAILGIMLGGFAYFNQLFLFPLYAHELGLSKLDGALLVSVTGMAEVCSRLLMGSVADRKFMNKTLFVIISSLLCSSLGMIMTLYPAWHLLLSYAAILGTLGGTFIPLAMPIVTEYVHLDQISSATGLFLCAMGMAFALGPPVLGKTLSLLYLLIDE